MQLVAMGWKEEDVVGVIGVGTVGVANDYAV